MAAFRLTHIKKRILRLLERVKNWIEGEGWKTDSELKECLKKVAEEAKKDRRYKDLKEKFDGSSYAPGTNDRPWNLMDAPIQSFPEERNPLLYDAVINQFGVSSNPRYKKNQQGKGETYCNIFVWDVTRAMGAEIPHWVDSKGNPTMVGKVSELDANGVISWLETYGEARGWNVVDAEKAQNLANQGYPVVAAWKNPEGIGHIAVVRPGEYSIQDGSTIAQAGISNFNIGTVEQGFRSNAAKRYIVYYYHE